MSHGVSQSAHLKPHCASSNGCHILGSWSIRDCSDQGKMTRLIDLQMQVDATMHIEQETPHIDELQKGVSGEEAPEDAQLFRVLGRSPAAFGVDSATTSQSRRQLQRPG